MANDAGMRLIVIGGPTASGKSALAAGLAERLGGVVINADSMQVYADLTILTARPTDELTARVPHRLYGTLDGAELCSAARWAELARAEIAAAVESRLLPIVCGGTGLYIRTLLDGIVPVPDIPAEIRHDVRDRCAAIGSPALHAELAVRDPAGAARLNPNDRQRIMRALEVVIATGRPLVEWQAVPRDAVSRPAAEIFLLMPSRELLNQAIDGRFRLMVEAGALAEVARLLARNLSPELPMMKALGVAPLAAHLAGKLDLEAAILAGQQGSRQYAKRQSTWFRHQTPDAFQIIEQYSERILDQICHKICGHA